MGFTLEDPLNLVEVPSSSAGEETTPFGPKWAAWGELLGLWGHAWVVSVWARKGNGGTVDHRLSLGGKRGMIRELENMVLRGDKPELGLRLGEMGTVVHVWRPVGEGDLPHARKAGWPRASLPWPGSPGDQGPSPSYIRLFRGDLTPKGDPPGSFRGKTSPGSLPPRCGYTGPSMPKGLFLLVLLPLLSACGFLLRPSPLEASLPQGKEAVTLPPGGSLELPVGVQVREAGQYTLRVTLADPCATGRSNCPGWDASRYPGVEHPREALAVSGSGTYTLRFTVAPDALPQGTFKYLISLSKEGREVKTIPFYLKILPPGERSGMEAWNFWREYAGLPPVKEDPEWSYRAWLHSRYMAMNYPNALPHDEDLSQPFASEEGRSAGRRGNEGASFRRVSGQPAWPPEEARISWWISAPFHRFNMLDPKAANGGFGVYKDVGPVSGYGDGWGRTWANLPNLYGGSSTLSYFLFPVPDKPVALNRFSGYENPNPLAPCQNPSASSKRPFLTQEGLSWQMGSGVSFGLPLTLQTFPPSPVDTEVLEARLTRLSDGAINPVCGFGSTQYWEARDSWREGAIRGLRGWGAVIVFPHEPLTPGAGYEAYLKVQLGSEVREYTWRFTVARESDLRPLRLLPADGLVEVR